MKHYIVVLDSGVGGLSVLAELTKTMPKQNFAFFGDTKNMPYGTKSKDEIYSFTKNIIDFFVKQGIKTVVFACNTTSAVAYDKLIKHYGNKVKIFPLIQTAAKSAISGLKANDTVAVMATRATINSGKYDDEIKKINSDIKVVGVDCTGFVEIVENRLYNDPNSIELIKEKLEIIKKANAKRVILGCTHYPYLEKIFKMYLDIEYFNPAKCLSETVKKEVYEQDCGDVKFFVSKDVEQFRLSAKTFFDIKGEIKLI